MKKFIKNNKGQTIVEFALVVPVFLIVLFGTIEFGNMWHSMNVLSGAAREGVRIAAVSAPDVNRVETTVNNYLNASNINDATITVTGPNSSSEVQVTIQMTYNPIFLGIIPGINEAIQMTRSATMHWES